jgi:hypothetical protein
LVSRKDLPRAHVYEQGRAKALTNKAGVVGVLRWVDNVEVIVIFVVAIVEVLMVVEKPAGSEAQVGGTTAEAATRNPRPWKKEDARPHTS